MSNLQRTIVNPAGVCRPIGAYSHAVRVKAGELLFIAGQVALDAEGNLVGKGNVVTQTRQIYQNIGTILESMGASFSNIVEFTTYVVGKESVQPYIEGRRDIFAASFPSGDYPPNTLLVIGGLAREEFLIEISTIAALP